MQTIKFTSGIWNIEAKVQNIGDSIRLAIISAVAGKGEEAIESKHTVVFEHMPGSDEISEAKACMQQVVLNGH